LRNEKYQKAITKHKEAMAERGIDSGLVRPRSRPKPLIWAVTLYIVVHCTFTMICEGFIQHLPVAAAKAGFNTVRTAVGAVVAPVVRALSAKETGGAGRAGLA